MTYANVVATFALVFAMGGSAVAASHYLITSKKQISPKALKEIAASGKTGPAGGTGATGAAGAQGPQGPQGAPGVNGTNGTNGANGERGQTGLPGPEGPEHAGAGERATVLHWRSTSEAGPSKEEAVRTTLREEAPFKLVGHCWQVGTSTYAQTYLETGEAGSWAGTTEDDESAAFKAAGEEVALGEEAEGETEGTKVEESNLIGSEGLFAAESKTGVVALDGAAKDGVFLEGKKKPACYFSGYFVSE